MTERHTLQEAVARLFPPSARCAAGPIEGCPQPACRLEQDQIGEAGPRRRAEFFAGRHYARIALQRAGAAAGSLLNGAAGAPQWPAGFTGSISHAADCCAAVAARCADAVGLGLDLERVGRIGPPLWRRLFTPREQSALRRLEASAQPRAATQLFCAKEAFYKAQHPLTGLWLGFLDVEIEADWDQCAFTVRCAPCESPGKRKPAWIGRLGGHGPLALAGVAAIEATAGPAQRPPLRPFNA